MKNKIFIEVSKSSMRSNHSILQNNQIKLQENNFPSTRVRDSTLEKKSNLSRSPRKSQKLLKNMSPLRLRREPSISATQIQSLTSPKGITSQRYSFIERSSVLTQPTSAVQDQPQLVEKNQPQPVAAVVPVVQSHADQPVVQSETTHPPAQYIENMVSMHTNTERSLQAMPQNYYQQPHYIENYYPTQYIQYVDQPLQQYISVQSQDHNPVQYFPVTTYNLSSPSQAIQITEHQNEEDIQGLIFTGDPSKEKSKSKFKR